MTATDEIRRLLDERGVEWWETVNDANCVFTWWESPTFGTVHAMGNDDGETLFMTCLNNCDFTPEQAIAATLGSEINGDTSDGYHTFNELYHHRAVLFSVVVAANSNRAWKSKLHHDGTMYDDMFIVGVDTPWGQASYHYDIDPYWDIFDCKELERAPEWDGHTPDDAIERIGSLRDVVLKGPRGRR